MTPAERSIRGRIGALSLHAQGKTNTSPARARFLSRFETEVDPDGTLPAAERSKRAEHARKLYFTWKARYTQMGQHVEWLFRRITPVDDDKPQNSFLTPRLLIQELQEKMGDEAPLERTVKAACSKAAKLVGISISSGARTPKTLLPRER